MNPYAEAVARQRGAADPAASVFVTANAGSGKTKVLVDRIARLLLAGAEPSAFLCITYTKAAAAEMQRRLFKQLGDWCVASDADLRAALENLTGEPIVESQALMGKARALFARALESPGGLKIQTIHAFCERLLSRFPLEAGVPPGFDIADDAASADMLTNAWEAVVRGEEKRVAEALARLSARLHRDRFEGLLRQFIEGRRDLAAFLETHADAEDALAALKQRHGAEKTADEIAKAVLDSAPDLTPLENALREIGAPTALRFADRIASARDARERPSLEAFQAFARIALKDDGGPYRNLAPGPLKQQHPMLAALCDDLQAMSVAASTAIRAAERFADAAATLALAKALEAEYARQKEGRGALDFSDLIHHAHALIARADAAPWVLYKLDGGLDHILIDEGQDTSPLQWSLIEPLQAEFFAGDGARAEEKQPRTVFAVGDPKQSIYSFQGADPKGFLDQARALAARAAAARRDFAAPQLDMSFRSTQAVLDVVDAVFAQAPLGAAAPEIFDVVKHVAKREGEPGRVEYWPLALRPLREAPRAWDAPLDMEPADSAVARLAAAIAAQVKTWIDQGEAIWEVGAARAMRAGDVMVLVRSRGALFQQMLKALKREGLPVAGADRMTLKDEIAVQDCLTLLRVAADPSDDLALACLLKSPWVGLVDDDADIFPLAHARAPGETLQARLTAAKDAKYAPAKAFVASIVARGADGPYALIAGALEQTDAEGRTGWARLFARLGPEARDPIEELLARALNFHARGPITLHAFLAQIERDEAEVKREMETAAESVRVMTVHGAKGLEAPVVILPQTTEGPLSKIGADLFITDDGPVFSASAKEDDAVAAAARAESEARQRGEHLRLLYVAMTRARDRLLVCGAAQGRGEGAAHAESWHTLIGAAMANMGETVETPFGEGRAFGERSLAPIRPAASPQAHLPPDWLSRAAGRQAGARTTAPSKLKGEPPALSPRVDGRKRFRRGVLVHALLERLPDLPADARAREGQAWLQKQGVTAPDAKAWTKEALAVIEAPAFARVFGPESRAEAPLIGRVQGLEVRGIVDRLVVRADEIEILDFKSDRPAPTEAADAPEAYVLQMALYRAVLQQIFPGRAVRCALVWTEKAYLTELPPAQMDAALDAALSEAFASAQPGFPDG
ncbi:MAG: double-strand break repair helicase AddA [Hyphomonadaceae bacterium]